MEREPQQPNTLEALQESIKNAEAAIQAEMDRSDNGWLQSFSTRVFTVDLYLDTDDMATMLDADKYKEARERMNLLHQRLHQIREQYPQKDGEVPDEIKRELLESLNILR